MIPGDVLRFFIIWLGNDYYRDYRIRGEICRIATNCLYIPLLRDMMSICGIPPKEGWHRDEM